MCAATIAVPVAAPNAPPTVRMIVLMPVAMPTSDCGTDCTIRLAIEASAKVMPAPSSMPPTMNSHGCVWKNASSANAPQISAAPKASAIRSPARTPSGPASGPASSWAPAVGAIRKPDAVTDIAKP